MIQRNYSNIHLEVVVSKSCPVLKPFHATGLFLCPLENFRKPEVLWWFQGGRERYQWYEMGKKGCPICHTQYKNILVVLLKNYTTLI